MYLFRFFSMDHAFTLAQNTQLITFAKTMIIVAFLNTGVVALRGVAWNSNEVVVLYPQTSVKSLCVSNT